MTTVHVCADGLVIAARQLQSHSDAIAAQRGPCAPQRTKQDTGQGTVEAVASIIDQVRAINTVLAARIETTAARLAAAGQLYSAADNGSRLADHP